jgi:hypothetical protein
MILTKKKKEPTKTHTTEETNRAIDSICAPESCVQYDSVEHQGDNMMNATKKTKKPRNRLSSNLKIPDEPVCPGLVTVSTRHNGQPNGGKVDVN